MQLKEKFSRNVVRLLVILIGLAATWDATGQVTPAPPAGQGGAPAGQGTLPPGTTIPGNLPANQGQQTGAPNQQGTDVKAEQADTNQNKLKQDTSKVQTEVDAERQELLERIFGYSLFSKAVFSPVQEQMIATPMGYAIGVGDILDVSVYGATQQPFPNLKVNRDGFINLPRIGNVYVNGKSVEEVTKILIGKLAPYNPSLLGQGGSPPLSTLKVSLAEVRGVQVYVTGEVMYPASYELSSLHTAFNALYLAGGPNEIGTFRDVKVIRDNEVVARIDIYDYLVNGVLKTNVRVQDNDNISVGYRLNRVELLGRVKRPGLFEMKPGETLSDLFRFAGGFEDDAYQAHFKILRFTSRERKIVDVTEDEITTFELQKGDVVTVEPILDRFENIVSIEGAVMRPGDYSLERNHSLRTLLESAQGLREDAFAGRVYVSRTRDDQTIENLSLNLTNILSGDIPDLELIRLDVVTIPSRFDMTEPAVVTITGEVNNTKFGENDGKFPYVANMTLEDLILKADGLRESADIKNIQVTRRKRDVEAKFADAQIAEVFNVSLGRDLSIGGSESGLILHPFDEVLIRKSPSYQEQKYVRIEGDGILRAGAYPILNRNDKISDIVARAGGLTELAYLPGATLIRTTIREDIDLQEADEAKKALNQDLMIGSSNAKEDQTVEENIGIKMEKLLRNRGSKDDLIVQENDVIRIPKRLETVQVAGEVLYPTTVKYNDGMTFLDFVSQSGGFTKQSMRGSSWIKYPNGSVDRTRRFLVFNIYPRVEPGAEIVVPVKGGTEVSPLQLLNIGIQVSSTLMTLILSVLAFRRL